MNSLSYNETLFPVIKHVSRYWWRSVWLNAIVHIGFGSTGVIFSIVVLLSFGMILE